MSDSPPPYDALPPNPLTDHLTTHLSSLPSLIHSSQQAHHHARLNQDLTLTSLLTPPITSLLHAFATSPTLPPLAELTLVPAAAVPPDWIFSTPTVDSARPRKTGEIRRLERVSLDKEAAEKLLPHGAEERGGNDEGSSGSNAAQRSNEFDDWGRWGAETDGGPAAPAEHLWFADEALAIRLAKLLQPATPQAPPQPPPPEPLPPARTSKWGALFKSPDPLEPARRAPRQVAEKVGDGVSMTVRAEEVTFRRENELGIWESRSGFGVVVRIRSRR